MHRRPVAVATLLVLAGCGGVPFGEAGGPATPRETLTPVALSPEETTATTDTPVERLPGVVPGGVVDGERLRETHETFLVDRSYQWTLEYDVEDVGRTESTFDQGFTRRASVEQDRFLVRQVNDGKAPNQSLFVNGSVGYLRNTEDENATGEVIERIGTVDDYVPSGTLIERFLSGAAPNVTRIERAGTTYYRLHDRTGVPAALKRQSAVVDNFSVTAYVTRDGFVRSMTVTYERTWEADVERVSVRFYYDAMGSATVERPAWVDDVPVATPTATLPAPAEATPSGTENRTGD